MLKKTIKYTDYNGTDREETFYFHLKRTKALKLAAEDGYLEMLQSIEDGTKPENVINAMARLIHDSYGEKDPTGRKFIQSDALSNDFEQTEAYDKLFMDLCFNADEASAFVNKLIPKDVIDEMTKAVEKAQADGTLKNPELVKELEALPNNDTSESDS